MHSHVLCCLKIYTNLLSVSLMMLFRQHTALEKSSTSDRVKKVKKEEDCHKYAPLKEVSL